MIRVLTRSMRLFAGAVAQKPAPQMPRRDFLKLATGIATLAAGCGGTPAFAEPDAEAPLNISPSSLDGDAGPISVRTIDDAGKKTVIDMEAEFAFDGDNQNRLEEGSQPISSASVSIDNDYNQETKLNIYLESVPESLAGKLREIYGDRITVPDEDIATIFRGVSGMIDISEASHNPRTAQVNLGTSETPFYIRDPRTTNTLPTYLTTVTYTFTDRLGEELASFTEEVCNLTEIAKTDESPACEILAAGSRAPGQAQVSVTIGEIINNANLQDMEGEFFLTVRVTIAANGSGLVEGHRYLIAGRIMFRGE